MKTRLLLSICSGFICTFAKTASHFDPSNYASDHVITRDVAIIGGGATGTYAAINLKLLGDSVVVVEKENILGGHTNTYTDPSTGVNVDYGVQAFWNISATRNYFTHLGIQGTAYAYFPLTTVYADFQTGQQVTGVKASNNYTAYAAQLAKYPYLPYSWNLPSPVPSDLLLPFGEFVAKYDLQDVAYSLFLDGEGFDNFLNELTVNILKFVDESFLDTAVPGGSLVPPNHNNGAIYTQATAQLGSDVLLSSIVVDAQRPSRSGSGVSLVVQTPSGKKLIQASKLLISMPPLLENMSPFDLDSTEDGLFSQWSYTNYFVMLVNNTNLPSGFHYANANAKTSTYHIPNLPAPYQITNTRIPGMFFVWYGSPYDMTQAEVEADVSKVIGRLRSSVNPTAASTIPNFVEFRNHTPFKLVVSADAISGGFYDKLEGLQGHRNTYYTGAAFLSHDAAELFNFTSAVVLPKMLA